MNKCCIVFLQDKNSLNFKYSNNIHDVKKIDRGFKITFKNKKTYIYGRDKVKYYELLSERDNVHIYNKGILEKKYNKVYDYGAYFIFGSDNNNCSYPVEKNENIEILEIKKATQNATTIIEYFKSILKENIKTAVQIPEEGDKNDDKYNFNKILEEKFSEIGLSDSRSVLYSYVNNQKPISHQTNSEKIIYPFGCNESQRKAVETSLSTNISIIEGPPGTGKTQTILNIIANIILQNKTVGIVSNNNSAVDNIKEKLEKYNYQFFLATLGKNDNKKKFFEKISEQKIDPNFEISKEEFQKEEEEFRNLSSIITLCFEKRNQLANFKTLLSDIEVQFEHLKKEQPLDNKLKEKLDKSFYLSLNKKKFLELKHLLSIIFKKDNKWIIFKKIKLIFNFGFFDFKLLNSYSKEFDEYTNHKFYELYIEEIKFKISEKENWLSENNEKDIIKKFVDKSKIIFERNLFEKYKNQKSTNFSISNYLEEFSEFTKRYPVILSTTYSLHTSIPKGYLLDYLIIDESSQVDLITSAICFSCCKNVIIVGDSMQLTHIVDRESVKKSENNRKKFNISSAYDYVEQNILGSLKNLYKDNLKVTLLKEHYRCHPKIIGFCNLKYYDNKLVILNNLDNDPFKIINTNISIKGKCNQRQIDETNFHIKNNYIEDLTKVGVIAPYKDHVAKLKEDLPKQVESDTIHKFQGREKEVIIFNTVKAEINEFIDNPNLINVAVSRAIKEFILIKPKSMDPLHGTNIGDLVRYILYNSVGEESMINGQIRSVFDVLYKEYNEIFNNCLYYQKGNESPAECIIRKLLEIILLNNKQFSSIDFLQGYSLKDLVKDYTNLSEEEKRFIKADSHVDFLLFNKLDKTPILAIEVDGRYFHDQRLAKIRDEKKNNILKTIKLPLLRLSTDGFDEEKRIIKSLSDAMKLYN